MAIFSIDDLSRELDPGVCLSTGTGHTSALFAQKSQSFLDNVVAGFGLRDHQEHCHDPPHTAPPCANHLSAFGEKRTDRRTQSMSQLGVKRTWLVAAHMSAFDPK